MKLQYMVKYWMKNNIGCRYLLNILPKLTRYTKEIFEKNNCIAMLVGGVIFRPSYFIVLKT